MKKTGVMLVVFIVGFMFIPVKESHAIQLGGKELVKSGTGVRTKFPLGTIYYATLYLPSELKGKSAKEIIDADEPMSVIMQIDSKFLTREKFVAAVTEGFGKAAASGYLTDKKDSFLNLFNSIEIKKGDMIYLNYVPKTGVTASYKAKGSDKIVAMGATPGLQFKKALFAIWLGQNPAQASLKNSLLGQ